MGSSAWKKEELPVSMQRDRETPMEKLWFPWQSMVSLAVLWENDLLVIGVPWLCIARRIHCHFVILGLRIVTQWPKSMGSEEKRWDLNDPSTIKLDSSHHDWRICFICSSEFALTLHKSWKRHGSFLSVTGSPTAIGAVLNLLVVMFFSQSICHVRISGKRHPQKQP